MDKSALFATNSTTSLEYAGADQLFLKAIAYQLLHDGVAPVRTYMRLNRAIQFQTTLLKTPKICLLNHYKSMDLISQQHGSQILTPVEASYT